MESVSRHASLRPCSNSNKLWQSKDEESEWHTWFGMVQGFKKSSASATNKQKRKFRQQFLSRQKGTSLDRNGVTWLDLKTLKWLRQLPCGITPRARDFTHCSFFQILVQTRTFSENWVQSLTETFPVSILLFKIVKYLLNLALSNVTFRSCP